MTYYVPEIDAQLIQGLLNNSSYWALDELIQTRKELLKKTPKKKKQLKVKEFFTFGDYVIDLVEAFSGTNEKHSHRLQQCQTSDTQHGTLRFSIAQALAKLEDKVNIPLVAHMPTNSYKQYSGYYKNGGRSRIEELNMYDSLPTIAHEYRHHLQLTSNQPQFYSSIIQEGDARGIERNTAYQLSNTYQENAFLREITKQDIEEYTLVRNWIAKTYHLQKTKLPSTHALGNSLFSVLETQRGLALYHNILSEWQELTPFPNEQPYISKAEINDLIEKKLLVRRN